MKRTLKTSTPTVEEVLAMIRRMDERDKYELLATLLRDKSTTLGQQVADHVVFCPNLPTGYFPDTLAELDDPKKVGELKEKGIDAGELKKEWGKSPRTPSLLYLNMMPPEGVAGLIKAIKYWKGKASKLSRKTAKSKDLDREIIRLTGKMKDSVIAKRLGLNSLDDVRSRRKRYRKARRQDSP